jgi:hypothetical protein
MEKQFGQDVIDSLSVLEAIVPTLHQDLWPKIVEIFPMLLLALRSKFAIIRQSTARCFSTICDVMTSEAMRFVIEQAVPLIADPLVLANRQGVTELIYRKCLLCMVSDTSLFLYRYRAEARYQGSALCHLHGGPCIGENE